MSSFHTQSSKQSTGTPRSGVGNPFRANTQSQLESPTALALPEPSEGIELLVEMAKRGEIDPWNVDLVRVADAYLDYVSQLENQPLLQADAFQLNQPTEEANPLFGLEPQRAGVISEAEQSRLRLTGKTLLYLAVLLRMKSDLLAGFDPFAPPLEDAELESFGDADLDAIYQQDVNAFAAQLAANLKARYGSLESVLERRPSAKQPRIRNVTLNDLVQELKKFEALERERLSRQKVAQASKRRHRAGMQDYSLLSTEDITNLAHDEFQEEQVEEVLALLEAHLPAMDEALPYTDDTQPYMSLSDLEDLTGLPRVICFLSLLFLEVRQRVDMFQPDFYSEEIYIRWFQPEGHSALQ